MQLRGWGASVDVVDGAPAARARLRIEAAAGRPYDLVLVDGGRPDTDGAALVGGLQPDALTAPVVLLAALGGARPPAEADACLATPVRPTLLLRALAAGRTRVAAPGDGARGRLLVVEDNDVIRKYTTRLLARFGYQVDAAASGDEAIAALSRLPYQAVFMDCGMPVRDGYETAAVIRGLDGAARHTPIIAMTASVLEGDRERCLAAGMDDYVAKPVNVDQLTRVLGRWVATAAPGCPAVDR
jgi:CheY-like chemotaxis protein